MTIQGTGIGLRQEFIDDWIERKPELDFIELVPENWMGIGGKRQHALKAAIEGYPIVTHGLSLSIGSRDPIRWDFLGDLKKFLNDFNVAIYSDHLSFASEDGFFYDLLPMPFSEASIQYLSERIRQVQDYLERPIALENISYYADLSQGLSESCREIDFINEVIARSHCQLLLDVNNVYVNSVNHGYDPKAFIKALPGQSIAYLHIAGHMQVSSDLIIDTHGSDVIESVWDLLAWTYTQYGVKATLLERDNDVPPLNILLEETDRIMQIQNNAFMHCSELEAYA